MEMRIEFVSLSLMFAKWEACKAIDPSKPMFEPSSTHKYENLQPSLAGHTPHPRGEESMHGRIKYSGQSGHGLSNIFV